MSIQFNELELFHTFVGQRLAEGRIGDSLDRAVEEFRRYQSELADLKAKLRTAEEQSERGESASFDVEETKQHVRERLSKLSKPA